MQGSEPLPDRGSVLSPSVTAYLPIRTGFHNLQTP